MKNTTISTKTKQFNFNKCTALICLLLTLSLLFTGCTFPPGTREQTKSGIAFDTIISVTLYNTANADTILEHCFSMCSEYENLFSRTICGSDIYQINHADGKPVTVDSRTTELIKTALDYCKKSDGSVDITIAPAKDLWDFSTQEEHADVSALPDESKLNSALSHVDYHNVLVDDKQNTVTLSDPSAQIDLGFIAKGYIADQLKDYLLSQGVKQAIINLGGNVVTIGAKADGTPYHIGIAKPFDDTQTAFTVDVTDSSVVTSGIYERYFKIDDKIYHHILNSSTGYPVENDLASVTILSESSTEGDALSTTCLLLGEEPAEQLILETPGVDAVFITRDGTVIDTREP